MDGKIAGGDERQRPTSSSVSQQRSAANNNPEVSPSSSHHPSVAAYIPSAYLDPHFSDPANVHRMVTNLNATGMVTSPSLVQHLFMQQAVAQQRHDAVPPYAALRANLSQPTELSLLQPVTVAHSILQHSPILQAGSAAGILQDGVSEILQAGIAGSPGVLLGGFSQGFTPFSPRGTAAGHATGTFQQLAALNNPNASQFLGTVDNHILSQFSAAASRDESPKANGSPASTLAHTVPITVVMRASEHQRVADTTTNVRTSDHSHFQTDAAACRREASFDATQKSASVHDRRTGSVFDSHVTSELHPDTTTRSNPANAQSLAQKHALVSQSHLHSPIKRESDLPDTKLRLITSHSSAFTHVQESDGSGAGRSPSAATLSLRGHITPAPVPRSPLVSGNVDVDTDDKSVISSPSMAQSHARSARSTPSVTVTSSSRGAPLTDTHDSPQSGPSGSQTSRSGVPRIVHRRGGGARHAARPAAGSAVPSSVIVTTGPNGVSVFQCSQCGKQFTNSSAIAKHKLTHSDERRYACHICSKAFKRQDHLNGHMLTHQDKKPHQCTFAGCAKSYSDARSLRRHLEHQHQNDIRTIISSVTESASAAGAQSSPATCTSYCSTPPLRDIPSSSHSPQADDSPRLSRPAAHLTSQSVTTTNLGDPPDPDDASSLSRRSTDKVAGAARLLEPTIASLAVRLLAEARTPPRNEVLKHLDELHPQQCNICRKRFKNQAALNGHMRLHGGFAGLPTAIPTAVRSPAPQPAANSTRPSQPTLTAQSSVATSGSEVARARELMSSAESDHLSFTAKLHAKHAKAERAVPVTSLNVRPAGNSASAIQGPQESQKDVVVWQARSDIQQPQAAPSSFVAAPSEIDKLIAAAEMMDANASQSDSCSVNHKNPASNDRETVDNNSRLANTTATAHQQPQTVESSLDGAEAVGTSSNSFSEVEIVGVADIVDTDLFNTHDDLINGPLKSVRDKHDSATSANESAARKLEDDMRKRRIDAAVGDDMMAGSHFDTAEFGSLDYEMNTEPTLWQCVSLGQRGVGVRSPSGTVYRWTPPSSQLGYSKPSLLPPQSHWQLTTALSTNAPAAAATTTGSGQQRAAPPHCADTITALALKNVIHTATLKPADETWRKRHYSAADIFADELEYSIPPLGDLWSNAPLLDSIGHPLLMTLHNGHTQLQPVAATNSANSHANQPATSVTAALSHAHHLASEALRHPLHGSFHHPLNNELDHTLNYQNGTTTAYVNSNESQHSAGDVFDTPVNTDGENTHTLGSGEPDQSNITCEPSGAAQPLPAMSTCADQTQTQLQPRQEGATSSNSGCDSSIDTQDATTSSSTNVQIHEREVSEQSHKASDEKLKSLRERRPEALHLPLHGLASLSQSLNDNWVPMPVRTRRPSFGYRSWLRAPRSWISQSFGGVGWPAEWNDSVDEGLSYQDTHTASSNPNAASAGFRLKASQSLFTPPPILSPFRTGSGLYWNVLVSKSRHASTASDAPTQPTALAHIEVDKAHNDVQKTATVAKEPQYGAFGSAPSLAQSVHAIVPPPFGLAVTRSNSLLSVKQHDDFMKSDEVTTQSCVAAIEDEVDSELDDDETTDDVEPHINIGLSHQADIPELRPMHEARLEASPPEQLLLDPSAFASVPEGTLEAYLDTARSAVFPGNGVNTELALRVLAETKGNVFAALEMLLSVTASEFKSHYSVEEHETLGGVNNPRAIMSSALCEYYSEVRVWTPDDIAAYTAAFKHGIDKEFCELARLTGRTAKECIEFYFIWKKAFPDEYARVRRARRRKEKAGDVGSYNLRSDDATGTHNDDAVSCSNAAPMTNTGSTYECIQCDVTFTTDSALRRHIAAIHRGVDPDDCDNDASATCEDVSTLNEDLETLDDAASSYDDTTTGDFAGAAKPFSVTDESTTHSLAASGRSHPSDAARGNAHLHDEPAAKRKRKQLPTPRTGPFTCRVCGRQFEKVKSCNAHMKSHRYNNTAVTF